MTSLPKFPPEKQLGLVIDLDTCVGCHACAVACKEWNTGGLPAPLSDQDPYGANPSGAWLNRVHSFEHSDPDQTPCQTNTTYFPKSCLHCADAPCVTVCPTGASYKRENDGIVLVNEDSCMGCGLCAWACPYGARELDQSEGVMKKCTLCVDRIYNDEIEEEQRVPACVSACPASARHFGDLADPQSEVSLLAMARGGYDLMPEMETQPTNKYLAPRPKQATATVAAPDHLEKVLEPKGFYGWLDNVLS